MYPRKGKCDQCQNCYQLQHPYLIWRILYLIPCSSHSFQTFFMSLQSCLFIFNSVDWCLQIKTDTSGMDFNLDFVNLEREEEVNQPQSGEKSNKCNQCYFASSQAGNLRTHLKMHSGEKPNKCNQCNYASSRAGDLRRHLRTHSGEKPNKCNQCDYASSRADMLRKHRQKHITAS